MRSPCIGDVVWVYRGQATVSDQPEAALITYVRNQAWVHVAGFAADGSTFAYTPIELIQSKLKFYPPVYCEWPAHTIPAEPAAPPPPPQVAAADIAAATPPALV